MVQIAIFTAVLQNKLEDYVNAFIEKSSKGTFEVVEIQLSANRHGEMVAMVVYQT